ncbi:MAG: aminotransferase class IV [Bacteroidetes bacterium]|nr:MAG: aminotransferase class IV [Bacteroidota bacterium]
MVNYNGIVLPDSKVALPPENRGLHYGDAVFETIKVSGGKVLYWEDHYFRLMAAMRVMRMEIPMSFTFEFLEDEIRKTIEATSEKAMAYRIKLLVWRSWGGKYTPLATTVEYAIFVEVLDDPFYTLNEDVYEVELFKDHYVNSGLLSTLKTNNRAVNVLAGIYAEENEYQNCLLLNENKQVIEALNGNLFLVNGDTIKTPPLADGCLNGIIRKQLITILRQLPDYTLEETSISPFELQKADELFVTNTIVGIQPISQFRKKSYTTNVAKDLLAKLNVKARLG